KDLIYHMFVIQQEKKHTSEVIDEITNILNESYKKQTIKDWSLQRYEPIHSGDFDVYFKGILEGLNLAGKLLKN
ncbi:unnamed protein product, partial [marine sediment metagenome]